MLPTVLELRPNQPLAYSKRYANYKTTTVYKLFTLESHREVFKLLGLAELKNHIDINI